MNAAQAKALSIYELLSDLKIQPVKETASMATYLSPFRDEKTASFQVNKEKNCWYDHGEGIGGNTLDFACHLLKCNGEDHTVADALRYLGNMVIPMFTKKARALIQEQSPGWNLLRAEPLENLALIRYLKQRGIPLNVAKDYLEEVYISHKKSRTRIYALGFKNEDGGYELRNPFFQSNLAPKTITFVRGTEVKPQGVHFFEGFFDFLTALTINKRPFKDDVIVLNSVSCIEQAIGYVKNYGYKYAVTWLDNDKAGNKATKLLIEFFKTEANLQHKPMNKVYAPHKDVNAWHMYNLNLKL